MKGPDKMNLSYGRRDGDTSDPAFTIEHRRLIKETWSRLSPNLSAVGKQVGIRTGTLSRDPRSDSVALVANSVSYPVQVVLYRALHTRRQVSCVHGRLCSIRSRQGNSIQIAFS